MTQITNAEAIQMMQRCKNEIQDLRRSIAALQPKAEAYDNIAIVLGLLPQPRQGMSEDMVWLLDKRINELQRKDETSEGEGK